MITANKEFLNSFFSHSLQYVVPFFQRAYVWDTENWETLWEHLVLISETVPNNGKGEHFIGTLITKQRQASTIGENKLDLIDGQQRLTTFSLLLKAIATKATGAEPYTKLREVANKLLVFENAKGEQFIRIEHSRNDREYFNNIMLANDLNRLTQLTNQEHKLLRCYRYFLTRLEGYTDEQLDNLKDVILSSVPLISMLLSPNDDEQEIFDTINSLGVRLTTGELLKNYIFSTPTIRPLYDTLWEPVFEEDEKQVLFWNKEKTSGRIIRTNIEVLLYCYLVIHNKAVVELERLFKEYKKWLQGKNHQEQVTFLEELKEYAAIYYKFPQGTELNEIEFSQVEERFFHVIESYEITTVYPLVLYIYKRVVDENVRLQLLSILESYLVRRNVCHLTTKNYNNLFIQIIGKLDESQSITVDSLKAVLTNFAEDTNKYPTDAEFKAAFHNEPISNANAREILYCISLYHIAGPKSDIRKLSSNNYSTEHMMPQKWQTNWSVPGMDEAGKVKRDRTIRTLGNLTLVTKNLNSSMKNAKWDKKIEVLKQYSHLQITTEYLTSPDWDETQIGRRAEDLASAALKIWKWPW